MPAGVKRRKALTARTANVARIGCAVNPPKTLRHSQSAGEWKTGGGGSLASVIRSARHSPPAPRSYTSTATPAPRLPRVTTATDLLAQFQDALLAAQGELVQADSRERALQLARRAAGADLLDDPGAFTPGQVGGDPPAAVVDAALGIAETGSVVLVEPDPVERRLSLFARTLVVILRQTDLVPSLDDAFQSIGRASAGGNYVTAVTGPSRTADIERSLTIGVQGPGRLIVAVIP